ncbi:hypothetical protein [Mycobacterium sp. PSTR-4-N]|uniref:hypothetical protein n=1 Tax=Mycobacterium sp. PSTR-4-N TaxID=2917745 RepID=UPI001F14C7B2|nr:hypothetical protein [Mycobacterium sp. PSTR-4-N]MCG7596286.1 hypothetical protein [Mycobacterium sp. PSTR-4-N]
MTKRRLVVAVLALIGAVLGALVAVLAVPGASRYSASANVALLPAPGLTTAEASSFWEVLTRGQVTRTAALVYDDPRWLSPAADAAKVPRGELSMTAAALPDTTILTVTVTGPSAQAAETALGSVLTVATPEAASLATPFDVKVLWPQQNSAYPEPAAGRTQVAAVGAFGGALLGAGVGWLLQRRRRGEQQPGRHHEGAAAGRPAFDDATDSVPARS